jgi:hypothetical protein
MNTKLNKKLNTKYREIIYILNNTSDDTFSTNCSLILKKELLNNVVTIYKIYGADYMKFSELINQQYIYNNNNVSTITIPKYISNDALYSALYIIQLFIQCNIANSKNIKIDHTILQQNYTSNSYTFNSIILKIFKKNDKSFEIAKEIHKHFTNYTLEKLIQASLYLQCKILTELCMFKIACEITTIPRLPYSNLPDSNKMEELILKITGVTKNNKK